MEVAERDQQEYNTRRALKEIKAAKRQLEAENKRLKEELMTLQASNPAS